ncbi:pyridoxal-phosphate-dependent aminotransferase family protein [Halospeciosus flavus]|uniref:Pyridoxal-phosphate-dependent aminotransferase family protein n=1 Tax=Halospeciosus flavus TaxID=3032283 RepID=A0ABD5Z790_9EURY|nr:alanine--glyoxylate aminotransferase family protein [Halospeciosus flavus]
MREDFLLLDPGPVPLSHDVREAMRDPMVSPRSDEFEAVYERAQDELDYVFEHSTLDESSTASGGTSLILDGPATVGMEAAVSNLVDDDSSVVAVVNGAFGRRFARIAERHCSVTTVEFEWGAPVDTAAVAEAVTDETDVVTVVHNETSTGVRNPVEQVGEIAAAHDAHYVVDGATSVGGDEFRIDDWNVDIAVVDGPNCLAAPPGVSALYVTDDAAEAVDGAGAPLSQDLDRYRQAAEDHRTPFTSAVPLFRGLAFAVEELRHEGMGERIARHRQQAAAFRDAFEAMGLDRFPESSADVTPSNTVTAVQLPADVRGDDSAAFFDAVEKRGVSIAGGQGPLDGTIFRVGNMGNLTAEQVLRGVRAVGESFQEVGVDVDAEAGLAVARERLR